MPPKLPITAVIPSFQCMQRIERHVAHVVDWVETVKEVVVVDSFSTDGTYEALQSGLSSYPHVRFIQRPKGLYESWNHGITEANQPWLYFSTVGDTITADGLRELYTTIEAFQFDILVSPPRFVGTVGSQPPRLWPVHEMIAAYALEAPTLVPSRALEVLTLYYLQSSLLGSSASNLYRTRVFGRGLFPTDFGRAGDSAWLIRHSADLRFGIYPRALSTFLVHEKDSTDATPCTASIRIACAELACSTVLNNLNLPPEKREQIERSITEIKRPNPDNRWFRDLEDLLPDAADDVRLEAIKNSLLATFHKSRFHRYKKSFGVLRYLHPRALYHRKQRDNHRQQLKDRIRVGLPLHPASADFDKKGAAATTLSPDSAVAAGPT